MHTSDYVPVQRPLRGVSSMARDKRIEELFVAARVSMSMRSTPHGLGDPINCVIGNNNTTRILRSHFGSSFAAPCFWCAPVACHLLVVAARCSDRILSCGCSVGALTFVETSHSSTCSVNSAGPSPGSGWMSPAWRGPRYRKWSPKKFCTSSPSCAASAPALSPTASSVLATASCSPPSLAVVSPSGGALSSGHAAPDPVAPVVPEVFICCAERKRLKGIERAIRFGFRSPLGGSFLGLFASWWCSSCRCCSARALLALFLQDPPDSRQKCAALGSHLIVSRILEFCLGHLFA